MAPPPEMVSSSLFEPMACYGPDGQAECGRNVEVRCPRCGCQRCFECCIDVPAPEYGGRTFSMHCPMCPRTDPETYPPPEVH